MGWREILEGLAVLGIASYFILKRVWREHKDAERLHLSEKDKAVSDAKAPLLNQIETWKGIAEGKGAIIELRDLKIREQEETIRRLILAGEDAEQKADKAFGLALRLKGELEALEIEFKDSERKRLTDGKD